METSKAEPLDGAVATLDSLIRLMQDRGLRRDRAIPRDGEDAVC